VSSRAPALLVAATAGLVAPLAVGPTTFEQRAALALLLASAAGLAWRPTWRSRLAVPATLALLLACAGLLAASAPAALAAERVARAAVERRAGDRLIALGRFDRALDRFEAAERLSPGSAPAGLAAAHLALAEAAVAAGLSAEGYRQAGEHLAAALAAEPSNRAAGDLAEAVAAVRQADVIWNQYDWPRTLAELRKAEARRPDLPGLAEKIRDAELSYQAARRAGSASLSS
jgi:tetratricopeptide (TPR) repeat protein